jgi:tRNA(fMet)-specific endonuclease VapC
MAPRTDCSNARLMPSCFFRRSRSASSLKGSGKPSNPVVVAMREGHTVVPVDDRTAFVYASVVRELCRRGELIGTNDLWIGCTSLRLGLPIVTANVSDFRRIDGLGIVQYR